MNKMRYLLVAWVGLLASFAIVAGTLETQWQFHAEGAATGSLQTVAPHEYALKTNLNNGEFAEMNASLEPNSAVKSIQFQIRSPFRRVGIWFKDSEQKTRQEFISLSGNPDRWENVEVICKEAEPRAVGIRVQHADWKNQDENTTHIRDIRCQTGSGEPVLESWRVADPVRLFRRPDDQSPVEFDLTFLPGKTIGTVACKWLDYSGALVRTIDAKCDSRGVLAVPPPEGKGFFELRIPELSLAAGVFIADAPPEEMDEYFAMDSSFSWGSPPKDEVHIRQYLQILRKNGIVWNRDRLSWRAVERRKGEFNYDNRFGVYRDAAQKEKMKTLDTFHDTPQWTGTDRQSVHQNPYPASLADFARSFVEINRRWSQTQKALEIWNEPDVHFGNCLPAWYVCSLTKAFSRAAADAGLSLAIGGGALAYAQSSAEQLSIYLQNGLLDDCDFLSYHTYRQVIWMEDMVKTVREAERKHAGNRAGIPHWITECGMPRPFTGHGGHRGNLSDDLYSAAEITGKAVEFRALGAAKFFFFEYKFRKENNSNFGNMDAHNTPMRALAAYFYLVRVLSGREYVGDLKSVDAVRSRVFKNDKDAVAVIYNGVRETSRCAVALPSQLKLLKLEGVDGRPLKIEDGQIPNSDGITFVYFPLDQLEELVERDTVAMKYYQMAQKYQPQPRAAKPLVMQFVGSVSQLRWNLFSSKNQRWPVRVWNFSDRELEFVPELEIPKQMELISSPKSMTIPAHGSNVTEFTVRIHQAECGPYLIKMKEKGNLATPIVFSTNPPNPIPYPVTALQPEQMQTIDEWSPLDSQTLQPDIKAAFRIFHEDGFLRLQVVVEDPEHFNPNYANRAGQGDSILMAIELREANGIPDAVRRGGSRSQIEFVAAKCDGEDVLHVYCPKNKAGSLAKSKVVISRSGEKTQYDLWLDPAEFENNISLQPGTMMGCAIVVNSSNKDGRHGSLRWGRVGHNLNLNLLKMEE